MGASRPSGFPSPPGEVLDRLGVRVGEYLGGREHRQWLVSDSDSTFVLRRYPQEPLGEVGYELEVLRRLSRLNWPVPAPLVDPFDVRGHTWCLFQKLPGCSRPKPESGSWQQQRGRLLAKLHGDTASLADLGQRAGWHRAEDVVSDPELWPALDAYRRFFPESADVLKWHAGRAFERFEALDLSSSRLLVLHGDFVPRNVLYEGDRLTGIVDFEATHLDHRVSDFALAWQGRYDDVITGYEQVRRLDELDRALLVPTLWAWLFLGVRNEIQRMLAGDIAPHGFDWQVGRLLRRSVSMGADAAPFPG